MQIHSLTPSHTRKHIKRLGRGGKRGTYSGRGEKGQRKRSGHRIRPAERDILLKFPKLRGIKNKRRQEHAIVFNVGDFARIVARLGKPDISKQTLIDKKIVTKASGGIKILGDGEITIAVTVRGIPVSKEARKKIEKAGGTVLAA